MATAEELLGSWESETFASQLGSATESLCFKPNHIVLISTATQAGEIASQGRYSYDGRTLTLVSPAGAKSTAGVARLTSTTLILTLNLARNDDITA